MTSALCPFDNENASRGDPLCSAAFSHFCVDRILLTGKYLQSQEQRLEREMQSATFMLANLSPAPEFSLSDHNAQPRTLHQLRANRPLVLLFFRGAFCATSRRDLLGYADINERIQWLGAELVAVSVDTCDDLKALRERLQLPFSLLSDSNFAVSRQYGIYVSDETEAGPQPHGEPGTFVLDAQGRLIFSQLQSGPKGAAAPGEILLMLLHLHFNDGRYWEE